MQLNLKHLIYTLILIIISQSVYHHFNNKKLQGIIHKQYEKEKKELLRQYSEIEGVNLSLIKQNDSLIKKMDENLNKVLKIEKQLNEKRNIILRTSSSDSLQRLIANRYR